MPTYFIWNIGCQMNRAESDRFAQHLDALGYHALPAPAHADVVVLNTCVVRGSAEDRVKGEISRLKGLKAANPAMTIAVTGCFVHDRPEELKQSYPHVDGFFSAGNFESFADWISGRTPAQLEASAAAAVEPSVFVPIMSGCNNFCSYCIVPYRRGRERSRPQVEVVADIVGLAERGAKEVTLLGQNVNSYGRDIGCPDGLARLLASLDRVRGLQRIRFLTSHPRDVDSEFIAAVAGLDRSCRWISLPVQAGNDRVLRAMRRSYTVAQYRQLVADLRSAMPDMAISTDVIVGFPGETVTEFNDTLSLIEEIKFDTVHVATYSPRPGTLAARTMPDDVEQGEKDRRLQVVEATQERILSLENDTLVGTRQEVLVERKIKGKWEGRTKSNRLVFFSDPADWTGRLATIEVTASGPWSLRGCLASNVGAGAK